MLERIQQNPRVALTISRSKHPAKLVHFWHVVTLGIESYKRKKKKKKSVKQGEEPFANSSGIRELLKVTPRSEPDGSKTPPKPSTQQKTPASTVEAWGGGIMS